ncbi:hypothetical protein ElyMa_000649600 [Elysia marginata]|uniref:SEA domain-containing protein n=1 Tax=Elysia marginata TaxID=1093978 RepID=A0AAV4GED6_9GAST|nr:hypothetical protein ElyMa_000649600 [Elysia marginata]
MLFQRGSRNGFSMRYFLSCQLLNVAMILLLAIAPGSEARRFFQIRSKATGEIVVLLDVEFTLSLTAHKDGQEVGKKQLTEQDIAQVRLFEFATRLVYLDFGQRDRKSAVLTYGFYRFKSPDKVGLSRFFELFPDVMFDKVESKLAGINFQDPGSTLADLGDTDKSYLCNRTQRIPFHKTSKEKDGYEYSVDLETTYFHSQAFTCPQDGKFSPGAPTVCPRPDNSRSVPVAIIAGSVAGGVVLMALIAAILVWAVRYRRRGAYNDV